MPSISKRTHIKNAARSKTDKEWQDSKGWWKQQKGKEDYSWEVGWWDAKSWSDSSWKTWDDAKEEASPADSTASHGGNSDEWDELVHQSPGSTENPAKELDKKEASGDSFPIWDSFTAVHSNQAKDYLSRVIVGELTNDIPARDTSSLQLHSFPPDFQYDLVHGRDLGAKETLSLIHI